MTESKERFRAAITKSCGAFASEDFSREGGAAAALLRPHLLWKTYSTILAFLSLPGEIHTRPLLEAAFADGKRVFVPRVEEEHIRFYRICSLSGLRKGVYGIYEPEPENALAPGDFPVLVITPGLAFDRRKNRLGRGKGYYDRFFAGLDAEGRAYTACGLCMNFQLAGTVPADSGDKVMDFILSSDGLF